MPNPTDPAADLAPAMALLATDTARLRVMDRAVLKAQLPKWFWPLVKLLVGLLPVILPLLMANRVAVRSGLADMPPGSPIPPGYDPAVQAAIVEARSS
jgi:hypothetical protein